MPNVNPLTLLGQIFAPRTTEGVRGYLDTLSERRLKSFFEEPERFKGVSRMQPGEGELSAYKRLSGGREWPMVEGQSGVYPSEPIEEPTYAMPKSTEEMTLEQAGLKGRAQATSDISQKQTELEGQPGLWQSQMANLRGLYTPEELGELSLKDIISGVEQWGEPKVDPTTGALIQTQRATGATKPITSRTPSGRQFDDRLALALKIKQLAKQSGLKPGDLMMIEMMKKTDPTLGAVMGQAYGEKPVSPEMEAWADQIINQNMGIHGQQPGSSFERFKQRLFGGSAPLRPQSGISP